MAGLMLPLWLPCQHLCYLCSMLLLLDFYQKVRYQWTKFPRKYVLMELDDELMGSHLNKLVSIDNLNSFLIGLMH